MTAVNLGAIARASSALLTICASAVRPALMSINAKAPLGLCQVRVEIDPVMSVSD